MIRKKLLLLIVLFIFPTMDLALKVKAKGNPLISQSDKRIEQITDTLHLEMVDQIGGRASRIAVSGNYVFMGIGLKLYVLDIANPENPQVIGQSKILPGVIADAKVSGSVLYLLARSGLHVFSISAPSSPTELSFLPIDDIYNPGESALLTDGNLAYISSFYGLRVIDISDLSNLKQIGFYGGHFGHLAVLDSYVYALHVSLPSEFSVINISSPQTPLLVQTYSTAGSPQGIAITEHYMFVGTSENLQVFSILDPSSPSEVNTYPSEAYSVAVDGARACVGSASRVTIFDISDPLNPSPISSIDPEANGLILDIDLVNDICYSLSDEGLHIIDISDPEYPYIASQYYAGDMEGTELEDSYIYVADTTGLRVINKTLPADLREESSIDLWGWKSDLALSGNTAYVVDGNTVISIVDISNPKNLIEVNQFYTPGIAEDIAVEGNYAYIADGNSGLRILDISNPIDPYELGHLDTQWEAREVNVSGKFAFVLDQDYYQQPGLGGLDIINIENPTSPFQVGYYPSHDWNDGSVAIKGYYAYLANKNGLQVLDVSDPSNPSEAGLSVTSARDIFVSGRYAFITGSPLLRIFDIGDPSNPQEVGYYDLNNISGYEIVVENEYVYITTMDSGLIVLRWSLGETLSISGRVVDGQNAPISGVSIFTNQGQFAVSDVNGYYSINGLFPGTYILRSNKNSYVFIPQSLIVPVYKNVSSAYFVGSLVTCSVSTSLRANTSDTNSNTASQNGYCSVPFFTEPFLELPLRYDEDFAEITENWNKDKGQVQSWFDHDRLNLYNVVTYNFTYDDVLTQANGIRCYDDYCYSGHNGIDFSQGSSDGSVFPAYDGTVVDYYNYCTIDYEFGPQEGKPKRTQESLSCQEGWGNYVWIDHGNNYGTFYAHLDSVDEDHVVKNKTIHTGDKLGEMGETGKSTGVHLHFGLYYNWQGKDDWKIPSSDEAVDPFGWSPDPMRDDPLGIPSIRAWADPNSKSQNVDFSGGYLFSPSGWISVFFPEGAVNIPMIFTIGESPTVKSAYGQLRSAGRSFWTWLMELSENMVLDTKNEHETAVLSAPISIRLDYEESDVAHIDPSGLSISMWDDENSSWLPLATSIDEVNHIARTQVYTTGLFDLQGPLVCPEDQTEPDDSFQTSSVLETDGLIAQRIFDNKNDTDWIRFTTEMGVTYLIETFYDTSGLKTVIDLYNSDGTTILVGSGNGIDDGNGTQLLWTAPYSDTYFLRISQGTESIYGCVARYSISIKQNHRLYLPIIY